MKFLVENAGAMNNIPFSKSQMFLKQINLSKLTEAGQNVITYLFGQFANTKMSAKEESEGSGRVLKTFGLQPDDLKVHFDSGLSRRYAGDHKLPRGRYYSIANDSSGNDGGTLLCELLAYAKPELPGLFEVWDLTIPQNRQVIKNWFEKKSGYQETYDRDDVFIVCLYPLYGRPHPLVEAWAGKNEKLPIPIYVEIPLMIKQVTVDKVIDLRNPQTAEWFAKAISNIEFDVDGEPTKCFLFKPPLKDFRTLIPTLLEQTLGAGYNFCKVAGLHLRNIGANGLIYPSARYDVSLELKNDKLKSSSGWNFVDYSGTEKPANWILTDMETQWDSVVTFSAPLHGNPKDTIRYSDVAINYSNTGTDRGSWSVVGLAKWQEAWHQTMMVQNILQFQNKKLFKEVYPAVFRFLKGQQTGQLHFAAADYIFHALLGQQEYIDYLIDFSNKFPADQKDIATALLKLTRSTKAIIEKTKKQAEIGNLGPLAILRTIPEKK